jgi:hypothetical protein
MLKTNKLLRVNKKINNLLANLKFLFLLCIQLLTLISYLSNHYTKQTKQF